MSFERDELKKLEEKPEVFAPQGPLEAPHKQLIPGPYWINIEEKFPELSDKENQNTQNTKESLLPVGRRDFVKLFGMASVASAASCVRRPAEKAISYVNQPVDQSPGVAVHYASTCNACPSACGILVKTREGRPVKLEGNPEHPINSGSLCSLGQAQIQGLYHPERLKSPLLQQNKIFTSISWDDAYKKIGERVKNTKKIGILTSGSTGNRHTFFKDVLKKAGSSEKNLYTFESNPLYASIAKAHEFAFDRAVIPRVELEKAQFLLGIGTDFQDIGTSPTHFTKNFTHFRKVKNGKRHKFVQLESHLSLTGTKADERYTIPAHSELLLALLILEKINILSRSTKNSSTKARTKEVLNEASEYINKNRKTLKLSDKILENLAMHLLSQPSVVLSGSSSSSDKNAVLLQLTTILINEMIGSYSNILNIEESFFNNPIQFDDFARFIEDSPDLDVLFIVDTNPAYLTPSSWNISKVLGQISTVVSIQYFPNETDHLAHFNLPSHHPLESWGDEQPVDGFWSFTQPVVRPLTDSRQSEDILLWIMAHAQKNLPYKNYNTYLEKKWEALYKIANVSVPMKVFKKGLIRKGFMGKLQKRKRKPLQSFSSLYENLSDLSQNYTLISPLDTRLHDGRGAHLPVLQEVADSLSTISWDSWLGINPKTAKELGLKKNQVAILTHSEKSIEVPVFPLPGIHEKALVLNRGNGHFDSRSKISYKNGLNPLDLFPKEVEPFSGIIISSGIEVSITKTDKWYRLAAMQKHNDLANRKDILKKISLNELKHSKNNLDLDKVPDLFPKLQKTEYRWGMAIDLDKCNGCGSCMVACSIENNIPQVGREEIIKGREMNWIRIDRYFSGEIDSPKVDFQPVMCQHCNHAPCEAVCPVYATTHDPEGLNSMTYNRCVGTRYCANACPYKVRRFNWWTHKWGEIDKSKRALSPRASNPDVTVRTRGVMEKCTLCVGRLRDAKHLAKKENRKLQDGEVKTACQQTCPTNAIIAGNLNDPSSTISKLRRNGRSYLLLGGEPSHHHYGLKTLPNVSYLKAITLAENNTEKHGTDSDKH